MANVKRMKDLREVYKMTDHGNFPYPGQSTISREINLHHIDLKLIILRERH